MFNLTSASKALLLSIWCFFSSSSLAEVSINRIVDIIPSIVNTAKETVENMVEALDIKNTKHDQEKPTEPDGQDSGLGYQYYLIGEKHCKDGRYGEALKWYDEAILQGYELAQEALYGAELNCRKPSNDNRIVDVSGEWSGVWSNFDDSSSGAVRASFTQSKGGIGGSINMEDFHCSIAGQVFGEISDRGITISFTSEKDSLNFSVNKSYETLISGTYELTRGNCRSDIGEIIMTRVLEKQPDSNVDVVNTSENPTTSSDLPNCPKSISAQTPPCFGEHFFDDGDRYVGEFNNGEFNGTGTYIFSSNGKNTDEKYSGEFVDGNFNGQGEYVFSSGNKYIGEFKNNLPEGQGKYIFSSGDKYVGRFESGVPKGNGVYTYSSGGQYTGVFEGWEFSGQGEYLYNNGDKYVGAYKDGKKEGLGTYTYANGDKVVGVWEEGEILLVTNNNTPEAEYEAGVRYYYGDDDLSQDYKKSFKWFRVASEKGLPKAQTQLARLYLYGRGVDQSDKDAIYWLEKSSRQGDRIGQFLLGREYDYGNSHLDENKHLAVYWYKKSAIQGLKESQYAIGRLYFVGEGVKKDVQKAYDWFIKSAEQGDSDAQLVIGYMYQEGHVVEQDIGKALSWFTKSARQDNEKAKEAIKELSLLKDDKSSKINTDKMELFGYGSGFVVAKDGVIATNYHVVDGCKNIVVDGVKADILDKDVENDLALLKVKKQYEKLASISYQKTFLGDNVSVFGYPLAEILMDAHISLTKGSVSGLAGLNGDLSNFRFSAAVQPGNSGGPIVSDNGEVVGITKAVLGRKAAEELKFWPQNVNFGIYSSLLIDMLKSNLIPVPRGAIREGMVKHYVDVTKYVGCYE